MRTVTIYNKKTKEVIASISEDHIVIHEGYDVKVDRESINTRKPHVNCGSVNVSKLRS